MKAALVLYFLLGLSLVLAPASTETTPCFLSFATLSGDEDGFFTLVGKTYGELIATDPKITVEAIEAVGSPELKKHLREFRRMLESKAAAPDRVQKAIRAELKRVIAEAKQAGERQRRAVEDTGNVVARTFTLDTHNEWPPAQVSPDGHWVLQSAGPPPGADPMKRYALVIDTVKNERKYLEIPGGFTFPLLSPGWDELLFIDRNSSKAARVPFANGKADWAAVTHYGPFPEIGSVGSDVWWVSGAEPHLAIGFRHPAPPYQFNWRTNVVTEIKGEPPMAVEGGTSFGHGQPGVITVHNNGPDGDQLQIYRVDKDGNARQVGQPIKGKRSTLSSAEVVFDKGGDAFVLSTKFYDDHKFSIRFIGFGGKPVETVAYPVLDRPRAGYGIFSHPTRNGVLVVAEDQAGSVPAPINQAYWLDLDTRKLSQVQLGMTIAKTKHRMSILGFSEDGKELRIQNGDQLYFVDFFRRIMD